jgi:hypothetical protein
MELVLAESRDAFQSLLRVLYIALRDFSWKRRSHLKRRKWSCTVRNIVTSPDEAALTKVSSKLLLSFLSFKRRRGSHIFQTIGSQTALFRKKIPGTHLC